MVSTWHIHITDVLRFNSVFAILHY